MTIFLDIDGVMVTGASWKSPEFLEDGFPVFTLSSCNALNKLISDDTIIILTTSHRFRYSINEWKDIFKIRGIEINNLKLLDKYDVNYSRKDEFLSYISMYNINSDYIIIDDDKSLNSLPIDIKKNLILTYSLIGLK